MGILVSLLWVLWRPARTAFILRQRRTSDRWTLAPASLILMRCSMLTMRLALFHCNCSSVHLATHSHELLQLNTLVLSSNLNSTHDEFFTDLIMLQFNMCQTWFTCWSWTLQLNSCFCFAALLRPHWYSSTWWVELLPGGWSYYVVGGAIGQ